MCEEAKKEEKERNTYFDSLSHIPHSENDGYLGIKKKHS